MRISDDRYSRDRLRLDLALRFIRHEARTHTIRSWTGLTDDRIRKLYRSYLHEKPHAVIPRHRGKSPTQAGFFTRTPRLKHETALLASLCCLLGLVPLKALPDGGRTLPGVLRGELLCQAFEAYLALVLGPQISFEHAVFLVTSLMRGEELKLTGCCECGSLLVVDRLTLRDTRCRYCSRPDPDCMTPQQRAALAETAPPTLIESGPHLSSPFNMSAYRNPPNFYSGTYIDRRADQREAAAWLEEARADPETRYIISSGTVHLLHNADDPHVLFLTYEHPAVQAAHEQELVLLGWFRGMRLVLVEVSRPEIEGVPEGARFEELRPLSTRLASDEAGLLAYVRALSIWRSRHRFCSVCGSPTMSVRAGHVLRCSNPDCAQEFFPRIDPAVIVLVTDGDRVLLGRQASWPAGRYSTIAGFVEPGESLEDAVAREVLEETGVRLTEIDYHSSQPWPFPSSLMVGFRAVAEPGSQIITPEQGELEDAGWFTRDDIASGTPLLPFSHSISYRLIQTWFDSGWPTPLARLRPGSSR